MKPLENLLVIELSTMITASFAAMMMAEQGARVIKVEPVEDGVSFMVSWISQLPHDLVSTPKSYGISTA